MIVNRDGDGGSRKVDKSSIFQLRLFFRDRSDFA